MKVQISSKILFFIVVTLLSANLVIAEDSVKKPHTFSAGTEASASEVNANFDVLYDQINKIGSVESILLTGWIPTDEIWIFANADDPEFTFTISGDKTSKYSAGMKIKLTQQTTTKYFIITKVSYSSTDYYTEVTI